MSSKTILIALFSVSLLAASKDWNGAEYHKNSASQQTAAHKMLEGASLKGDERILDIGCGDAKITAKIAGQIPKGRILGVDISESMIDFANKNFNQDKFPNLSFEIGDAAKLDKKSEFDLVVSFSTLQWVLDQQGALSRINQALVPGGKVLISMPGGYPDAMAKALSDTMAQKQWASYFKTFKVPQVFFEAAEYRSLMEKAGFESIEVSKIPMTDEFPSIEAFSNFVKQWLPHLQSIPAEQRESFMKDFAGHYLGCAPANAQGQVFFYKQTLEAKALKANEKSDL